MARVTVEDCLRKVEGRFDLAILAARRAKMIQHGSKPLIDTGNKAIVTALREIAAGKVWFEPKKDLKEETVEATFEEAETAMAETNELETESAEAKRDLAPTGDNILETNGDSNI